MKIFLDEDDIIMEISNDSLESDSFVNIIIKDSENEIETCVSLDEIIGALKSFDTIRNNNLKRIKIISEPK